MADTKRPQQFHPSVLNQQEKEMRLLELGEAWSKNDFERIGEITQEMKNDGISGIGNEHYRAQEAFGEFDLNEEKRLAQQAEQPPSAAIGGELEGDPLRKPREDARQVVVPGAARRFADFVRRENRRSLRRNGLSGRY